MVSGWNSGNRLVVGRNVKPGQRIQLAVFGANGPLSNPPTNFIYMRSAKLEFLRDEAGPVAIVPADVAWENAPELPSLSFRQTMTFLPAGLEEISSLISAWDR